MLTDPDSASPDCTTTHVNASGPSPSDPLPVHVPVRFSEGVDAAGDGAAMPAQAANSQPAATPAIVTAPRRAAHLNSVTNSMIRSKNPDQLEVLRATPTLGCRDFNSPDPDPLPAPVIQER